MVDRIDALEPVEGKSTVLVRIGETDFEIGRETAESLGLAPGIEVGAVLRREIAAAADRRAAAARILRHLRARPRTGQEVREYLARHGHGEETVRAVLAELEAKGLVDDARYAAWFVRGKRAHRPLGTARLVRELVTRGIPRQLAEAAAQDRGETGAETSELELALVAARSRFAGAARLGRERGMRRMHGFLSRRGFSEGVVREACLRLFAGVPRDAAHTGPDSEET